MLKANAWPHPVAEITLTLDHAKFQNEPLEHYKTPRGLVINARQLRDLSRGEIEVRVRISMSVKEVSDLVFGPDRVERLESAFRILCEETKFRDFVRVSTENSTSLKLPLERVHGVVAITPLYVTTRDTSSRDGTAIYSGGIVAVAADPIFVAIDQDWSGEEIPVKWKSFDEPPLQSEALLHVHLSGGSALPEIWLNERFKSTLEPVLTRTGNSPAGYAGAALRECFAVQAWEKILPWAVETYVEEEENWPATRIVELWRNRFAKEGWDLPEASEIDYQNFDELSLQIQHCLKSAQRISRVQGVLRFSPESVAT